MSPVITEIDRWMDGWKDEFRVLLVGCLIEGYSELHGVGSSL